MGMSRRTWFALLCVAVAGWLGGCATPQQITAQVSTHGQWPSTQAPLTYAFERLPSQAAQADWQARVEAWAAQVLARKGFTPAAADKANVWVQVAAQARTVESPGYPYSRIEPSVFGGVFGRHGGLGVGFNLAPDATAMQADVLLRERLSGQVRYETRATHERPGGADERLWPALFDAALQDFPAPAVSPRAVTVPTGLAP